MAALPKGSVIGIVGAGQLGQMSAQAAAKLGYKTHIFGGGKSSPAGQVADACTSAAYDDAAAMDAFAEAVDVITFEFENVPSEMLQRLAKKKPVHPSPEILRTTRHRLREKDFINSCGIPTAPYKAVFGVNDADTAIAELGIPCILKTCELGYDGHGQVRINEITDAEKAWESLHAREAVMEGFVPFACELSIVVARNAADEMRCFPVTRNLHRKHILNVSTVPAEVPDKVEKQAQHIAETLASALNLIGIMAVELFMLEDGSLIVNELAPRPHNSGHWTMDGAATSQFEQHIRAITGMDLGDTSMLHPTKMINLIGQDIEQLDAYKDREDAFIYDYGKREVRTGRKMGHVNIVKK